MPLEIRELVIRAKINEQQTTPPGQPASNDQGTQGAKAEIIAACVEQVLEILRDKKER